MSKINEREVVEISRNRLNFATNLARWLEETETTRQGLADACGIYGSDITAMLDPEGYPKKPLRVSGSLLPKFAHRQLSQKTSRTQAHQHHKIF